MIKVEVFTTPGCDKCARARETLKSIAEGFGRDKVSWREVDVLEEMDYAVELGVTSPPAIAIDGALVFPVLPSAQRFGRELRERLERMAGADGAGPRRERDGR
ncbi:glutaredoxin domain-containing protein [Pelomicrobium sp. G1]|uniref:glutaredoxin domain-containing protein n=1 Tax=unclassified Pelomicrobium TaxID=2815318 RepID=UPI003469D03B